MDRAAIGDQINRILNSPSFAGKSQLKKLLEVLFSRMDSQTALKPDRVIRELWPDEGEAKGSADVATEISRLRKALECYYSAEGQNDPIIISLPNRSAPGPDGTKERRWIVAEPRSVLKAAEIPPAMSPVHQPPLQVVKGHKRLWTIVALAAAGIAALVFFRYLTEDNQPRSGRLDESTLTIVNAEGKELWRKSFPDGFWHEYYEQGVASRVWFGDLDGDGHTEVLLLYHPAVAPMSRSTTLICYSDRGKEKWRWTPGRELPEMGGSPATFRTVGFGVLKAPPGTPSRIVVSSWHIPFYAHQIAIVDPTGKTLSEYWHSGALNHLALVDLNDDGRQEIIATGISNGYHQATLVALDPDKVFGASAEAARPEIQIHGMGAAQERIRLLFPRSDLNKIQDSYNEAGEVTAEHGRIRLSVRECFVPGCDIWYEFDKNFHLLSVLTADRFRSAHREFQLEGKIDHALGPEGEAAFQRVRCLVGCKTEFIPNEIPAAQK